MVWLRVEDQWDHDLTWVLGCDGNGHLAAMEHEAGIEWVCGLRLRSGCGFGSGY